MKKFIGSLTLLFSVLSLCAQSSKEEYKKRSEEVRNEVWNWNIKAFKETKVPDSAKKFSYVVIARHNEVEASARNKVHYYGISMAVSKEKTIVRTFRERVKIQDKAALESYSSINYTAYEGKKVGVEKSDVVSFVGVRIIKPDGAVKEVDADETVFTVDEKRNREAKLAISGLEIGDILDYYIQLYKRANDFASTGSLPLAYVLADEVPVLHYSLHGVVSKKFALEHISMNGAPKLRVSEVDGDWEFSASVADVHARPTGLWFSSYRQMPIIRLHLIPGGMMKSSVTGMQRHKAGNLNDKIEREDLYKEIAAEVSAMGTQRAMGAFGMLYSGVNALLKSYQKKYGAIPDDSLAAHIFYAMRYVMLFDEQDKKELRPVDPSGNYRSINENKYLFVYNELLKMFRLEPEVFAFTSKYGPEEEDIFLASDLTVMIKPYRNSNQLFSMETLFTNAGAVPYHYENQEVVGLSSRVVWKNYEKQVISPTKVALPFEKAMNNHHLEHLQLSFPDNDLSQVNVKRNTVLTGHFRAPMQQQLLLYEDFCNEERSAFGLEKNFVEELESNRKTKALAEEYQLAMKKAREAMKEVFTQEINDQFGVKPVAVTQWKVRQSGIRHTQPDLIYDTEFKLDNITKRAGENYLIDLGALLGGQLDIKDEQRNRKDDVYMPYARSFMHVVEMDIPKGYAVEGLENIQTTVNNATGWFSAKGNMDGNKLILKIEKGYRKSFLKAEEWPALLEMMDKAVAFKDQKLLLKKI